MVLGWMVPQRIKCGNGMGGVVRVSFDGWWGALRGYPDDNFLGTDGVVGGGFVMVGGAFRVEVVFRL